MMMNKKLNVKGMVEAYKESKCNDEIWLSLHNMYTYSFITWETWTKFYNKCKDWNYNEITNTIEDGMGNTVYTDNI